MNDEEQKNSPAISTQTNVSSAFARIDAVAPKGWRMRLAKAAAQLIAGTERGAVAYGEVRERLDTIEGRATVNKALAEAVAQQAVNDPETMERAKARFLGSAYQKQQNLEAVIAGASDQLLALAAPSVVGSTAPDASQFEEYSEVGDDSTEPLNPDWAASFSNIAENATSDELRNRLSRVLAGELASPGTFSRATVRLISELEREDIQAMQNVLPYVLDDMLVRTRGIPSMPNIVMMLPLAEAGLLTEANEMLSKTWSSPSDDRTPIGVIGQEWCLAITLNVESTFQLPIAKLTRAGSAVVDLLGRPDERPILRKIAKEVPAGTFSKIQLGRWQKEGERIEQPIEQLFPEIPSFSMPPMASASPFSTPNLQTKDANSASSTSSTSETELS